MQWSSLLTVRTRRRSIAQQDPLFDPRTRNLRLFGAGAASLALGLCVVAFLSRSPDLSPRLTRLDRSAPHTSFVPFFHRTFGTRPVPVEAFFLPLAYGVVLLALDEARKAANRR